MNEPRFYIYSSGYNASKWVEQCLKSVQQQTYKDYIHIVVDDASTDDTYERVKKTSDSHVEHFCNQENLKWLHTAATFCKPKDDDIVIILDLDDWLAGPDVLEKLHKAYASEKCWLTYGSYARSSRPKKRRSHCRSFPKEILLNRDFRKRPFISSHLRTFRGFLWNRLRPETMFKDWDGNWADMACDCAIMYPMLEMCKPGKIYLIKDVLCIYNDNNPLSNHRHSRRRQQRMEQWFRSMPKEDVIIKKVFISGCYDILHGGHLEFFAQAKALGNHLTICLPSDEVLALHKNRKPSLPLEHKIKLLEALEIVDEVVVGDETDTVGLNFKNHLLTIKPDYLAVTEDDQYSEIKRDFCEQNGIQYVKLPKTLTHIKAISTTGLVNFIKAPTVSPLRIDFAGGWLDCKENATEEGYIVNCTITPFVGLQEWPYKQKSGLGGSAAYSVLLGQNAVQSEENYGNGWQDAAIVEETGLCVWRALTKPKLEFKTNPEWLNNKIALLWTGEEHSTKEIRKLPRDYSKIINASHIAAKAVKQRDLFSLCDAIDLSYQIQIEEGMKPLPSCPNAHYKYCGSGWGGYALYLFCGKDERDVFVKEHSDTMAVEPYMDDKY